MSKKKEIPDDEKQTLYTRVNGIYVRSGRTVETVPAGFYNVVNMGNYGYGLRPTEPSADELIDIPGTVADEIFQDIDSFLETKSEYELYRLTHKRGYLFYGPPGSGKTSLGQMLARRFIEKVNGVVIFVGEQADLVYGVEIMRDIEPGRPSMYLIEEADNVVDNTHCLSILDGELSISGAVFVAMTNYKDRLPPRIANRPGRFDRVTRVDCPPREVQIEYLRRVEARAGRDPEVAVRIVDALEGLQVSMAHLREAFISHVLMNTPMLTIRDRFDQMMNVKRDENGKVLMLAIHMPDSSEPDDDDDYVSDRKPYKEEEYD